MSLMHVKNQEKVKAPLNGLDVGNVEEWTEMSSALVVAKLKPWDALSIIGYEI